MNRRLRPRKTSQKKTDEYWMARALALAAKGGVRVSPNPQVGACVVKAGRLVSMGYHARFGGPHAEREALRKAGRRAKGATLYVTLEPCSSWGKTPPCLEAILDAGISRVVVAMPDPNPLNRAKGLKSLRLKKVSVQTGVLRKQAESQNESFTKWVKTGRPFVTLKMAQSLDGKIACSNGLSRWISGSAARQFVHELRRQHDAVMVGQKTALLDNPSLLVNLPGVSVESEKPWRVILDPKMNLSSKRKVFSGKQLTLRVVSKRLEKSFLAKHTASACGSILFVKEIGGRLDFSDLLRQLGQTGVSRLLVEGGGETAWSLLSGKHVDRIFWIVAPKFIGGRSAVTSVEGPGVPDPNRALNLKHLSCQKLGRDWLFEGRI